jgi:Domain of unknown function (DUF4157)
MKVAQKQANTGSNHSATNASQSSWQNQLAQVSNTSKEGIVQRATIDGINDSPRMLAQQQKIEGYLGLGQPQATVPVQPTSQNNQQTVQRERKRGDNDQLHTQDNNASILPKPNHTGLPDNLKSGIESLSGISMDNVRVHYNSDKPAQLNALAYAQGKDIHLAPGQEKHLPHETWHIVQQAQGRVRPTTQMKTHIQINDDKALEHEADVMGWKAVQTKLHKTRPDFMSLKTKRNARGKEVKSKERKTCGSDEPTKIMPMKTYNSLQRKFNIEKKDYDKLGDFQAEVERNSSESKLLKNAPDIVRNIVEAKLIAKDVWKSWDNSKPIEINTNLTDEANQKLTTLKGIRFWIKALNNMFNKLESASGFTESGHHSLLSKTEQHDKNWTNWVNNHAAMINVKSKPEDYTNKLETAIKAAEKLDSAMDVGKKSYNDDIKAIEDFTTCVKNNRKDANEAIPIVPKWTQEANYGTGESVTVEYIPGYTMPRGSGSPITTPIDWFYEARKFGEGGTAQWVKGHLLNDHVGGPAKNYNLAPLDAGLNAQMANTIEYRLKIAISQMTAAHLYPDNVQNPITEVTYQVQLGAPRNRTNTGWWTQLYTNLDKSRNSDDTTYSYLEKEQQEVLNQLGLIGKPYTEVKAKANLQSTIWTMEDQLVRNWAIKLKTKLKDSTTNIEYCYLENLNRKHTDRNAPIYLPTDNNPGSTNIAPVMDKTKELENPAFLEAKLAGFNKKNYKFLKKLFESRFNSDAKLPEFADRKKDLEDWQSKISGNADLLAGLAEIIKNLENPLEYKKMKEQQGKFKQIKKRYLELSNEDQKEIVPKEEDRMHLEVYTENESNDDPYSDIPSTPVASMIVNEYDEVIIERSEKRRKTKKISIEETVNNIVEMRKSDNWNKISDKLSTEQQDWYVWINDFFNSYKNPDTFLPTMLGFMPEWKGYSIERFEPVMKEVKKILLETASPDQDQSVSMNE